jgi:hypothetical protein
LANYYILPTLTRPLRLFSFSALTHTQEIT